MKTFLHSVFFLVLSLASISNAKAQCTVSDIIIQNVTVIGSTANSCTVKFDVTFNIADNGGNKFIFIHAWLEPDYPNYFKCVNGQTTQNGSIAAPKRSDLIKSFLNIGLDNTGATPVSLASYPPDGSVPMATMDGASKVVLPDGSANITLFGVVAVSPVACTTPVVVVADLWSSQSATAQRAHCVNCGIRSSAGYLTVFGVVACESNSYRGTITNNTGIAIDGYYKVYADVNNDGYFTPTTDTLLQSNTNFTVGAFGTIPVNGALLAANYGQNIFIVITQTTGSASGASRVVLFRFAPCGPLPVSFHGFTASRTSKTNVLLKWETATENNNKGFVVQRKLSNAGWEQVTYVVSNAVAGNSSMPLEYSIIDNNSSKSLTQYRIQQVDLDGRTSISDTRVVRGDGQNNKVIVYPNPSTNGRVVVVFEDQQTIRDMILVDMFGKQVKFWRGITANTVEIDRLAAGIYSLKVITRDSDEQTVTKIVVANN